MITINSKDRRIQIINRLYDSKKPVKGQNLAQEFNVTRQIIVRDIAILRAEGNNIIATPDGYIINDNKKLVLSRVIAVNHDRNDIYDELKTIIKYGGTVKDVTIEHSIYGEIRAMLMIKTLFDADNFVKKINNNNAEPLSRLTKGVHLHTIEAENNEILDQIISALKEKGYLVCDSE